MAPHEKLKICKKIEALCEQQLYTNELFLFVTTEWKKAVKFNHTLK
jgi:hypothetical protein